MIPTKTTSPTAGGWDDSMAIGEDTTLGIWVRHIITATGTIMIRGMLICTSLGIVAIMVAIGMVDGLLRGHTATDIGDGTTLTTMAIGADITRIMDIPGAITMVIREPPTIGHQAE